MKANPIVFRRMFPVIVFLCLCGHSDAENLTVDGGLIVNSNATAAMSLTVSNNATVGSNLAVNGVISGNGSGITSLNGSAIAVGSVTASQLSSNAVDSSKIQDGSLTGMKLATNTITGGKIAAGTITGANLANGAITSTQLADGSVTTGKLDIVALDARYVNVSGDTMGSLTVTSNLTVQGTLNASSNRITNLATPTAAQDAATKSFVETKFSNVQPLADVPMGVFTNQ